MSNIPIPLGWKVIVLPKQGKTMSDGGIDVSAAVDAEEHLTYLGEVLAVGEQAFMARTKGGIDMSQWKAKPQVGDHVLYFPHAGMRIRRSGEKERWLLLMNDTDIAALVDDPDDFYSWVDA